MTDRQRRTLWVAATIAAIGCTVFYLLASLVRPEFRTDSITLTLLIGWQLSLLGLYQWRNGRKDS